MLPHAWTCIPFLLFVVALRAEDAKDLQKSLHKTLVNQVFMIRNFYGGDHLTFDSQGNLLKGGEADCWCAAMLKVQKIGISKDVLTLRGPRMVGLYDFRKAEQPNLHQQSAQVQLDIELGSTELNEGQVIRTLEKIFLTKNDLEYLILGDGRAETRSEPVLKRREEAAVRHADRPDVAPGEGVTPPQAIYTPDPLYTEAARRRKREGDVLLWVVIDAEGHPRDAKIVRCLGAGLDESAIEAVSRWRFKPAKKNGQSVAVQINIDMTFRLN